MRPLVSKSVGCGLPCACGNPPCPNSLPLSSPLYRSRRERAQARDISFWRLQADTSALRPGVSLRFRNARCRIVGQGSLQRPCLPTEAQPEGHHPRCLGAFVQTVRTQHRYRSVRLLEADSCSVSVGAARRWSWRLTSVSELAD